MDQTAIAAPDPSAGAAEGFESSAEMMPVALRGAWRADDLGRAPLPEDCDETPPNTANLGKVLDIRPGGYGLVEQGGRLTEVHDRTDSMIDGTFDTTPQASPRQVMSRRVFALQETGRLTVDTEGDDGVMDVTRYRRCPDAGSRE